MSHLIRSRQSFIIDKQSNAIYISGTTRPENSIYKVNINSAEVQESFFYQNANTSGYYNFIPGALRNDNMYFIVSANTNKQFRSIDIIDKNNGSLIHRYEFDDSLLPKYLSLTKNSSHIIVTNDLFGGYRWSIDLYPLNSDGTIDFLARKPMFQYTVDNFIEISESIYVPQLDKLIILNSTDRKVLYYDNKTDSSGVLSGDEVGDGPLFNKETFGLSSINAKLSNILYSALSKKLILSETLTGRIFEIDPESGDRRIISTLRFPYISPGTGIRRKTISSYALYLDEERSVFYSAQNPTNSVLVVDTITDEQVVLSKDNNQKYYFLYVNPHLVIIVMHLAY